MLKFFRKHARGWFMLGIIAIIIIVFVLYFGSDRGSQAASVIAIVDGRVISAADFHTEHERMLDMVRQRYGANIPTEILKQMDLKQKTYDDLISRHIIIAKAEDLKVKVSDDELREMITSVPAFQTSGIFDERKYRQMLRANKISAEDFEALQRVNLMASRIEMIVREGIKVSEEEVFDLFVLQNQKINLQYVKISGQNIKKTISPTAAELGKYITGNSAAFRRPEHVKVKYLYFPAAAFAPGSISDAEVRDYYDLHKDSYRNKADKQLSFAEARSLIFKELSMNRGAQKAQAEAKKARDVIYQENNFDEYGRKNNLVMSRTGFFPVDNPPPEFASVKGFEKEILELREGDLSRILVKDSGYYLIELVEKKASYVPQFKEIENEVRKHYVFFEKNRLAAEEARLILEKIKTGEPFDKAARASGFGLEETGFFQPGDSIPKIGANQGDAETLYQLSAANPYPANPLFVNGAHIVFKLKGTSKVDRKDFEGKKAAYERMLLNVKQEEAMRSWLEGNKEALIKAKRISIKKQAQDL